VKTYEAKIGAKGRAWVDAVQGTKGTRKSGSNLRQEMKKLLAVSPYFVPLGIVCLKAFLQKEHQVNRIKFTKYSLQKYSQ